MGGRKVGPTLQKFWKQTLGLTQNQDRGNIPDERRRIHEEYEEKQQVDDDERPNLLGKQPGKGEEGWEEEFELWKRKRGDGVVAGTVGVRNIWRISDHYGYKMIRREGYGAWY